MARAWCIWWILLAGLYLLLADNVVWPELVVGAVAATFGATAAVLVRARRPRSMRPRARWLLAAGRPLLGVVTDIGPLVRVLVLRGVLRRPGTGSLVELPFDAGADSDRDAAYRILNQTLGSLAPNTIVVDLDEDRDVLIAHQLRPERDPRRSAIPVTRP